MVIRSTGKMRNEQTKMLPIIVVLLLSHFSRIWLCVTPWTAAHHPWDSPGKNTAVGCHFLLQCRKVKSESEVTQLCPTLRDTMDCSLPGSSIHGIFQARVLEWIAISFVLVVQTLWIINFIPMSETLKCQKMNVLESLKHSVVSNPQNISAKEVWYPLTSLRYCPCKIVVIVISMII